MARDRDIDRLSGRLRLLAHDAAAFTLAMVPVTATDALAQATWEPHDWAAF
jgi:hypothetical protein